MNLLNSSSLADRARTTFQSLILSFVESSSPLIRKLAQWLSTRQDVVDARLCRVLEKVRDQNHAHDFTATEREIVQSFGADQKEQLEVEEKALASGVIAQIHKAKLNINKLNELINSNGDRKKSLDKEQIKNQIQDQALNLMIDTPFLKSQNIFQPAIVEVAIKVRHPNVEYQMGIDQEIVKNLVQFADQFGLRILPNLNHALNEFESSLMDQINLKNEMKCIIKFNNNFQSDNSVIFPKPIVSSESVIVESFQNGVNIGSQIKQVELLKEKKINQIKEFIKGNVKGDCDGNNEGDSQSDRNKNNYQCNHFIVSKGMGAVINMIFRDKFFHIDLHPGNLLFQDGLQHSLSKFEEFEKNLKEQVENGQNQFYHIITNFVKQLQDTKKIVVLDCGMAYEIANSDKSRLIKFLQSIGNENQMSTAQLLVEMGRLNNLNESQIKKIINDVKDLQTMHNQGWYKNIDLGIILRGILQIARENEVAIDSAYQNVMINFLCLEGMAKSIEPSQNILENARPILKFHEQFGDEVFDMSMGIAMVLKNIKDQRMML